jgi:hypothetical protein
MSRPIIYRNMDSCITAFRISFFLLFHLFKRTQIQEVWRKFILLYSFFWVILLCMNFMCGRFGTVCPIFIGGVSRKSRKILILNTLNISVWHRPIQYSFIHISLTQATIQRHSSVHIYKHQSDTGHCTAPQLSTHLYTSVWYRPLYSTTAQDTFIQINQIQATLKSHRSAHN